MSAASFVDTEKIHHYGWMANSGINLDEVKWLPITQSVESALWIRGVDHRADVERVS